MKISVSTLNLIKEEANIIALNNTNIDYMHIDIMDNSFVPNYISQYEFINDFKNIINKPLDVHLMVSNVFEYVDLYSKLNPKYITFHFENGNVEENINYIKSKNIKVGLSIKPNTEIKKIVPYLHLIDLVLIMSVEPGYGGQPFIKTTTSKIKELKIYKKEHNFIIEVDGGINDKTLEFVSDADMLVIGSFITNSSNYQEKIDIIKNNFKDQ